MSRLSLIALLWLLLTSVASSADSCAARYSIEDRCLCDKEVQRLPVPTPNGFSLFAVCGMHDIKDGNPISLESAKGLAPERFDMGTYLYRGRKTLAGRVVKSYDPALDYRVTFHPTRHAQPHTSTQGNSRLQEFALLKEFSLISDEKKIGTQNLAVTEKVSWCSEATVTLKEIEIYVADTEGEGPHARKYDVVRLSKFRKC